MSNLQIGLAIAGGLILAGIVAHATWSARRNQPKRATLETPPEAEAAQGTGTDLLAERQEPRFENDGFGDASLASLSSMMAIEKKPGLDALIDVIAPVMVESVVSGEAALAAMPATRRAGSKPFGVEGLNAANDEWELPAAGIDASAASPDTNESTMTGAITSIRASRPCLFSIASMVLNEARLASPKPSFSNRGSCRSASRSVPVPCAAPASGGVSSVALLGWFLRADHVACATMPASTKPPAIAKPI